ncbi:MAG: thioesterase [Rhodobacteraceae bacterium]|jgi:uncharacterized protein (TIGR00369 family)|nr:thioesterase [Paracoccaceae bacterium]MEC7194871.1 PaaI family thioesterase [Pseudomonadota bacterium]|tara:strand:- start:4627 stop:5034 length:408 start_codon:yes stop_codon:yes gene_type:complete
MKNVEDLKTYFEKVFFQKSSRFEFLEIGDGTSLVKLSPSPEDLRPGNTVSGPVMFEIADCAFYAAILFKDPDPMSVTVNCSINFFKRPSKRDLFAKASILKFGQKLVVGEVTIFSENIENKVAQAMMTYARPVKK